jgi:hypothetical protein
MAGGFFVFGSNISVSAGCLAPGGRRTAMIPRRSSLVTYLEYDAS